MQNVMQNLNFGIFIKLRPIFFCPGWEKRFPNDPMFKSSEMVKKLVKEGRLGKKTGAGWYKYNGNWAKDNL